MPTTGKQIPDILYTLGVEWWVTSIPPYYCWNTGSIGVDDLSNDKTWIGTSFTTNGSAGVPTRYTNGVKFSYTTSDGSPPPPSSTPTYVSQSSPGSPVTASISPLNGGLYPNPYLQSSYSISSGSNPLFFGPYPLNKTANPTNIIDGDIMFITTGSDVIGGVITAAPSYGINDGRQYNLIFYSTGSANVERLSEYVGDTSITGRGNSGGLPTYATAMRALWYVNTGVTAFVAIRSVASSTEITWWPLTYDDNNVTDIISRNDS